MHISQVDLNLFTVFDAIYTEGSVTRASLQLNLTQPAISHALARLRLIFDDPLFVRQGHAMVSTPLARSIIEPVRLALRGLEVTLADAGKFDPNFANKQFNLAVRDVLESSVLPPLMQNIVRQAPQITLAAIQVERRELVSELAAGTIDLAIDMLLPLPNAIQRQKIVQDTTVVIARKCHPAIKNKKKLGLDTYLKAEHVLASSRRKGMGLEDFELSRLGLQRRIRLRCQHYFAACRVVSQTDLLLTMPERFARVANEHFNNQILTLPLVMPSWDVYLYWHQNVENDPANRWLRDQVAQAFARK